MSNNHKDFPGLVLFTGSNGGIGLNTIECFLKDGKSNFVCHYKSSKVQIEQLLKKYEINPVGRLFEADLSQEEQVTRLREQIEAAQGPVWGVVNFAGASTNAMSWKMTLEDFRFVMDANLTSTFLMTREFVSGMRQRGNGRLVNTSSIVAHQGVAGASHYCAAKAGIEGYSRAVAVEVANKGITVNALALGYFEYGLIEQVPPSLLEGITESIPLKRLGKANEIKGLLDYLLSPDSNFVTGQIFHLNGGQRL
jgi:NAD(P)-dependent dehydrogenase (short-subunit alcohol dehydrogenase family)